MASHFSLLNALWPFVHRSLLSVTKKRVVFVLENGLNVVLNTWSWLRSLEKATASNSGAKAVSYSREMKNFSLGLYLSKQRGCHHSHGLGVPWKCAPVWGQQGLMEKKVSVKSDLTLV